LERDSATHYIHKTRYANSMVKAFENFIYLLKPNSDIYKIKNDIYKIGMSIYNYKYEEIENAVSVIKEIANKHKVVFVTVGTREEQVKKLAQLNLTDIDFEIFDHKDEFVFRNLCIKYRAKKYFHIGDSTIRDIEPTIKLEFDGVIHIDNNLELDVMKISKNHYKINHISNIKKIDIFVA